MGLLGVWRVSHWCGFDTGRGVCIIGGVRLRDKESPRWGLPDEGFRRPRENE